MTTRKASCSCGQLSVSVDAEPLRVSICHCLACQRRTGSPFGAQARFPAAGVRASGRERLYVRVADSGNELRFRFCPDCGATVYYELEGVADVIAIPLGAFADPHYLTPTFSVFETSRHAWVTVPDGFERHD